MVLSHAFYTFMHANCVTIHATAFFHQVLPSGPSITVTSGNPVIILKGLNHWNFASGDDNPPSLVKKDDIKSEVAAAEAHTQIASIISNFLDLHFSELESAKSNGVANLTAAVEVTKTILTPLINAMQQAGHQYLIEPCNSDFPTNPTCKVYLCLPTNYAAQHVGIISIMCSLPPPTVKRMNGCTFGLILTWTRLSQGL